MPNQKIAFTLGAWFVIYVQFKKIALFCNDKCITTKNNLSCPSLFVGLRSNAIVGIQYKIQEDTC
jgi:hypothetical protein